MTSSAFCRFRRSIWNCRFCWAPTRKTPPGAAHLTQTSYPIGGENTNCVLAAHRGYYKAPMLREVERLQIGDTVYLQNFRETLTYTVSELRIIDPSDVDALLIQPGRDLLTLVTCHPLGSNRQRYVVYCERAA